MEDIKTLLNNAPFGYVPDKRLMEELRKLDNCGDGDLVKKPRSSGKKNPRLAKRFHNPPFTHEPSLEFLNEIIRNHALGRPHKLEDVGRLAQKQINKLEAERMKKEQHKSK